MLFVLPDVALIQCHSLTRGSLLGHGILCDVVCDAPLFFARLQVARMLHLSGIFVKCVRCFRAVRLNHKPPKV